MFKGPYLQTSPQGRGKDKNLMPRILLPLRQLKSLNNNMLKFAHKDAHTAGTVRQFGMTDTS